MTTYYVRMNDHLISWHGTFSEARRAVLDYRHVLDIAGVDSRVYDFTVSAAIEEDLK